ncbi:hypothetical protein QVD17_35971 [Tagetes erecta]|uniref:C2H2-type domain-containing protein n=1 Tax=Tagetes erecta TaxID=13708 RepID=A0AAD8JRG8_TARER|nr:hypothetical protein QVD17_35971 [Tagetes erecta]
MSVKRIKNKVPINNPYSSWEEQAFAKDACGPLGGFVWPPRSYTCSFCKREFKSAQALGGHMNVHRRQKAKLKQPSHAPAQNQESSVCKLDSNSADTKSCFVYDEDLMGHVVQDDTKTTSLVLGFHELDCCYSNIGLGVGVGDGKRLKMNSGVIMEGGLDLELRLTC